MVGFIVIYCFCLFKKRNVVEANGSNNMNMCGLKPHERLLELQWAAGKEISKEEGAMPLIPSSTGSCSGLLTSA